MIEHLSVGRELPAQRVDGNRSKLCLVSQRQMRRSPCSLAKGHPGRFHAD